MPAYDFFAPKGVSPSIALALEDAIKYAATQPKVKSECESDGNIPVYTAPAAVFSELKAASKHLSVLKTPAKSVG